MKAEVSVFVLIWAALAVRPKAATGYLRSVGPSPIYFRVAHPPGALLTLPPLDMGDGPPKPETNPVETTNSPAGATALAGKAGQKIAPTKAAGAAATTGNTGNAGGAPVLEAAAEPSPLQLSLSPQALVPFFTRPPARDTNAPKISVVVPVEFHPGLPPPPAPPSSATLAH